MEQKREALVQRWQTEVGQLRREQVIHCLLKRKDLSKLPFLQRREGRWDLRGINFQKQPWHTVHTKVELPEKDLVFPFTLSLGGRYRFKKLRLEDVDFSWAHLGAAIFQQCHFRNVLFREANLSDWKDRASEFRQVDFYKADLRGATLGLDGARYEHVSFRRADMRRVSCYRGYFVNCDFSEARLEEVDFNASHFINCKFKGPLRGVWFRGYYATREDERRFGKTEPNPMENADFSEAVLWDVMFTNGCDLSKVIPPQDGEHFLLRDWPQVLAKAKEEVERNWEGVFKEEALPLLELMQKNAENQEMYIINRREFEHQVYTANITGVEEKRRFAVELVELLRKVEAEVSQEK